MVPSVTLPNVLHTVENKGSGDIIVGGAALAELDTC